MQTKRCYALSAFIIFMFCFQELTFAQSQPEAETLFGKSNKLNTADLGFFIAPSFGYTQIDGSDVSLFNLRSGVIFNDKFSLGGYFNTSMNEIRPQSELLPNTYMDYWTVGGFAEYTLHSSKVFHLTFPLYIGYGEVELDSDTGMINLGEENFFQVEPAAILEVNLHKNVRFNFGVGYRIVNQMNYRNLDQTDMSGVTGYAGLKVGLFR